MQPPGQRPAVIITATAKLVVVFQTLDWVTFNLALHDRPVLQKTNGTQTENAVWRQPRRTTDDGTPSHTRHGGYRWRYYHAFCTPCILFILKNIQGKTQKIVEIKLKYSLVYIWKARSLRRMNQKYTKKLTIYWVTGLRSAVIS